MIERYDEPEHFEDYYDDEIDEVERTVECPKCNGLGCIIDRTAHSEEYESCPTCSGEGVIFE